MFLLLFGLPVVYEAHHQLQLLGVIRRSPKYTEFFMDYPEFMEAALPLCWIGAALFLYGTWKYKDFFVQYLISDFIILRLDAND